MWVIFHDFLSLKNETQSLLVGSPLIWLILVLDDTFY